MGGNPLAVFFYVEVPFLSSSFPFLSFPFFFLKKCLWLGRDLLTDGSFSQRRHAQWCFVIFMSAVLHLIVWSEAGNTKKEKKKSAEMELHLTKKAFTKMLKSLPEVSSFHKREGDQSPN